MGLFDALVCWLKWMVQSGASVVVDGFKALLIPLAAAANAAIALLPTTAMDRPPAMQNSVLGTMNYFLPIAPLATQALVLIAAWALYRLYRYLFGWVG